MLGRWMSIPSFSVLDRRVGERERAGEEESCSFFCSGCFICSGCEYVCVRSTVCACAWCLWVCGPPCSCSCSCPSVYVVRACVFPVSACKPLPCVCACAWVCVMVGNGSGILDDAEAAATAMECGSFKKADVESSPISSMPEEKEGG